MELTVGGLLCLIALTLHIPRVHVIVCISTPLSTECSFVWMYYILLIHKLMDIELFLFF